MPARKDRDGSITIRFAEKRMGNKNLESIFSLSKVIKFLEEISDTFIIGLEQPGALWTQHYQIAVILREEIRISDDLKRRLIRYVDENLEFPLSDEERKRAIECKYHNDIKYCIGYCSKDSVAYKRMEDTFHTECVDHYRSHKNETKIPVSRSRFLPLIREMYDELWKQISVDTIRSDKFDKLDNCKKFTVLEKMLIARSYDTSCISPAQKREIISHFHEYIVGHAESSTTDVGILDLF